MAQNKRYLFGTVLFAFFFPLIVFWRFWFPVGGHFRVIGNDFGYLYYSYKVYLLDFLSRGDWPLWSPSEGAGFPFLLNPFVAPFYPINIFLLCWYKWQAGYTWLDHQFFTICGIALYLVGTVVWLSILRFRTTEIFIAICFATLNLKFAELIRFPNAVHSIAWYPWILAALTSLYNASHFYKRFIALCGLIMSLFCLFTAGYPYFFYYGVFLFPSYVLFLLLSDTSRGGRICYQNLLWMVSGVFTVFLLLAPYIIAQQKVLSQTTDRDGRDFAYSTAHEFTVSDITGSFLYPPIASTEGWMFGGIIPVFLIFVYFIFSRKNGDIDSPWYRKRIKTFFLAWCLFVWAIVLGRYSPFFEVFWNYFPGFSALRVWGRFQVVLLPFFSLLVTLGAGTVMDRLQAENPQRRRGMIAFVCLAILLIVSQRVSAHVFEFDPYWKDYFSHLHGEEGEFLFRSVIALLILFVGLSVAPKKYLKTIFCVLVYGASLYELSPWLARVWIYQEPGRVEERQPIDLDKKLVEGLRTSRTNEMGLPLSAHYRIGPMPNWYYQSYTTFYYDWEKKDREDRDRLLGLYDSKKVYFSPTLVNVTPQEILSSTQRWKGKIEIVNYDGDYWSLNVDSPESGYVIFIDNSDPEWYGCRNGEKIEIELALGTFKAVLLVPGSQKIELLYSPFFEPSCRIPAF